MKNVAMAGTLNRWMSNVKETKRQARVLERVVTRMKNSALAGVWDRWHEQVVLFRKQREHIQRRQAQSARRQIVSESKFLRMKMAYLAAVLLAWRQAAHECGKRRSGISKCVFRILDRRLLKTLQAWSQNLREVRQVQSTDDWKACSISRLKKRLQISLCLHVLISWRDSSCMKKKVSIRAFYLSSRLLSHSLRNALEAMKRQKFTNKCMDRSYRLFVYHLRKSLLTRIAKAWYATTLKNKIRVVMTNCILRRVNKERSLFRELRFYTEWLHLLLRCLRLRRTSEVLRGKRAIFKQTLALELWGMTVVRNRCLRMAYSRVRGRGEGSYQQQVWNTWCYSYQLRHRAQTIILQKSIGVLHTTFYNWCRRSQEITRQKCTAREAELQTANYRLKRQSEIILQFKSDLNPPLHASSNGIMLPDVRMQSIISSGLSPDGHPTTALPEFRPNHDKVERPKSMPRNTSYEVLSQGEVEGWTEAFQEGSNGTSVLVGGSIQTNFSNDSNAWGWEGGWKWGWGWGPEWERREHEVLILLKEAETRVGTLKSQDEKLQAQHKLRVHKQTG
jgi:hypothetical protein